jgi:hypothetical protein
MLNERYGLFLYKEGDFIVILPAKLQQAKETLKLPVEGTYFENPSFPVDATIESLVVFVELYIFHLQQGDLYFAACDTDITFIDVHTDTLAQYKAFPIERGNRKSTVDNKLDNVELKVSNFDDSFTLALFQGYDLRGKIVDIIEIAWDTLNNAPVPDEYRWVFRGSIDNPELNEKDAVFKVVLKPSLQNIQCGRIAMLSCNADFGDIETCGAFKDLQLANIATSIDENEFYINIDRPDGYWNNGLVTIGYETKRTKSNIGTKITTEYPFSSIPIAGANVTIQRHCTKTFSNCKNQFNNHMDFSGIPSLPSENIIKT